MLYVCVLDPWWVRSVVMSCVSDRLTRSAGSVSSLDSVSELITTSELVVQSGPGGCGSLHRHPSTGKWYALLYMQLCGAFIPSRPLLTP